VGRDLILCERHAGIAIKFLRNKLPSAHIIAMFQLGGTVLDPSQSAALHMRSMVILMIMVWADGGRAGQSNANFFEHDLTNHVPDLGTDASVALQIVRSTFAAASNWPTMRTPPSLSPCIPCLSLRGCS
jgi:hypothetical protein